VEAFQVFIILWLGLLIVGIGYIVVMEPERLITGLILLALIILFGVWMFLPGNGLGESLPLFLIIWLLALVIASGALLFFQTERRIVELTYIALLASMATWISLPTNPGILLDLNRDGIDEVNIPFEIRQGLDLAGGIQVLLEADVPEGQLQEGSLDEARRIIEQRVDSLGTLEPTIQTRGERRIIVELPGYSDPEAAVDLIRDTALLEFVDFGINPPPEGAYIRTTESEDPLQLDDNSDTAAAEDGESTQITYFSDEVYETVFTGEILANADVSVDQLGQPLVSFTLTPDGSRLFGDYTGDNIGTILGIVLDGRVLSTPVIQSEIRGQGQISGDFDLESANQLATQLRYGALPVPLRVDSTTTVGPTLGQISVEQSIRAGLIGIAVVIFFMVVYYRVPGIAAAFALLIFAVINFSIYKVFGMTMTLPAITGFLIGIGTAVDGNILIFERLKEELRKGRSLDRAVEAGFDRAFPSIRDSNISTIIICIVLYIFGTSFAAGPVQGFALTLALSLVINLFTAIVVTRTILHFLMLPINDQVLQRQRWLLSY